jgi:hypothetical protein
MIGITSKKVNEKERAYQEMLKKYPHGVIGKTADGIRIREWHIDHAPTLEQVLSGNLPSTIPKNTPIDGGTIRKIYFTRK